MMLRIPDAYRGSTLGIALAGAILYWAALPPLGLWPLAWIGPAFWVWLVRREEPLGESGRRPYARLWLVGFLFWLAALHWLRLPHWATSIGWIALAFYLGFYLPVFVGLSRVAVHRLRVPVVLAAPVVWTGLELARAHLLTGITMGALAHTQYRWLALIQVSDLGGAYAVDFVIMFVAASLASIVPCGDRKWTAWPLVPAAALMSAVLVYGHFRLDTPQSSSTARIALIQGSIDIELKHDPERQKLIFQQYYELTDGAVRELGPLDAIVWPETMFRGTLVTFDPGASPPKDWPESDEQFQKFVSESAEQSQAVMGAVVRRFKTPMILGVDTYHFGIGQLKRFNSAAFVDRDGRLQGRYDKMHRVLFGEYVPFADRFAWLQRLTPLPVSLDAGSGPAAFEIGGLKISPNICYESVLPHVIRGQVVRLARRGQEPDVLVNLTNDGWFWGSSELDMHLVCAVFRAVECRKPYLIAANTGFSAWIDGDGRIREQGPRRTTGVLLAEVGPDARTSWYLQYGDVLAGLCLAACLILAFLGAWKAWQDRPKPRPES